MNQSIQCKQCGGAAVPVSGREYMQCAYCRTLVFTTENPLIVDRIAPLDCDLNAPCPACRSELRTGQIEGRPALYCGGCFGVLLKNEHFGAIIRERRARRSTLDAEPSQALNMSEYERTLRCPNCERSMEVHPYYGPGNVVMDSCSTCQFVWLDHGELFTLECSEGGREPDVLPMYINSAGEVTFIPPAPVNSGSVAQF